MALHKLFGCQHAPKWSVLLQQPQESAAQASLACLASRASKSLFQVPWCKQVVNYKWRDVEEKTM